MLVKGLLKLTPEDHVDYQGLAVAGDALKAMNDSINAHKRKADGAEKWRGVAKGISKLPSSLASTGYLVKEGQLKVIFILFILLLFLNFCLFMFLIKCVFLFLIFRLLHRTEHTMENIPFSSSQA